MTRKDITSSLSLLLEKHIDPHNDPRIYWAKEVTFDYATENPCRVAKVMHPDAGGDAGAFQLLRENYGKCLEKVGDQ